MTIPVLSADFAAGIAPGNAEDGKISIAAHSRQLSRQ